MGFTEKPFKEGNAPSKSHLSHLSLLGTRKLQVPEAWSLQCVSMSCRDFMPWLHDHDGFVLPCHSIRGCLPLRAKWLWLWAGRCGRADLENGSHDVSGLRTCFERPLKFIEFPGSSVEEALQPDPLCPEPDSMQCLSDKKMLWLVHDVEQHSWFQNVAQIYISHRLNDLQKPSKIEVHLHIVSLKPSVVMKPLDWIQSKSCQL